MKISFVDFWTGFDQKNNFFTNSLKSLKIKFKIVKPNKADVIFFSCFGQRNQEFKNSKKIFFLSEDFDLNNYEFDYSISHLPVNKNNIRLPLWKMYIDWFDVKTYNNPEYLIPLDYIDNNNEFNSQPKNKFCTIVYSSEYFFRENYINLVSEYRKVDVFGKNKYGNMLPEGEFHKIKHLSNYKFSLAMENEISTGYICEKLIHAKIAGNIPLFYGDDFAKSDFNEDCFIHITDYEESAFIEIIKEIENDKKKYNNIFKEKLFNENPSIDEYLNFLYEIIV